VSGGIHLHEIREGLARLLVPDVPTGKGPGKFVGLPFYNPTMEKNRDMTVLLLKALNRPGISVFDGLAATGAMGIRVALEAPETRVTCNDHSSNAASLVQRNAELNGVKLEAVITSRFQAHLSSASYEFIDMDPFGTPAPYVDSAFQAAPRDGIVAVTATDTAVLCGAQKKTCIRRYEARPLHIDCCKEIGLRILIGFCVRNAARYDRAATPLLSISSDHYFRVFMRTEHGAKAADDVLSNLGYVSYDHDTGERRLTGEKDLENEWAGPLWVGDLADNELVARLTPAYYMRHPTSQLVEQLKGEAKSPPLFVTSEFLARLTSSSPPPMERFLDRLKEAGFIAKRTHIDPGGVKTDAPWSDLVRLYRDLSG